MLATVKPASKRAERLWCLVLSSSWHGTEMVSAGILLGRVERGSSAGLRELQVKVHLPSVHQGFSFSSRVFAQRISSCSGSWGRFVLRPAVQDVCDSMNCIPAPLSGDENAFPQPGAGQESV